MQSTTETINYVHLQITSSRAFYNNIGSVFCNVLNEDVIFNARGFHHLLNNSDGTPRDVCEIKYKLTLLPLVIPVIKNATGINEERDVMVRDSRKKKYKLKKGKTYALTALVGRKNPVSVRVILLKIGNGNLMFRSVMKD